MSILNTGYLDLKSFFKNKIAECNISVFLKVLDESSVFPV